jgi:serine protease inhibitor
MEPEAARFRLKGMRNAIRVTLGLLSATAVAVATGCASAPAAPQAGPVGPPALAVLRGVAAREPAADPRPFGAADTTFGLGVLRAWCQAAPAGNLVFSPSTLATALGMAYLGARGATAQVMARTLHLPVGGQLEAGLRARTEALAGLNGPGVTLAASNQVWADPALPPLRGYLNAVATGYDAGVTQAPLLKNQPQAADEINRAISAATRGHIPRLVTPDMLADVGWVLTSALYMNAAWATPFDPNKTASGEFTRVSGQRVTVKFMNGTGFSFASAGGWTAVSLPYKGGKLSMTALLPPPDSASCAVPGTATLRTINAGLAANANHQARFADTALVSMPRVNISTTATMNSVLEQLGMGLAFDPSADFSGLSPQASYIKFVQQAATLQVGEKGTVASAAVAVGIVASSGEVALRQVVFDRPYLMLVTDTGTGEPLFLAKVANPAAS